MPISERLNIESEIIHKPTAEQALAAGKMAKANGAEPTMRATLSIDSKSYFNWELQRGSKVIMVFGDNNFEARNDSIYPIKTSDLQGFSTLKAEDVTDELGADHYKEYSNLAKQTELNDFQVLLVRPQNNTDQFAGHVKILLERKGFFYKDVTSVHYTVLNEASQVVYRIDTISYKEQLIDVNESFHWGVG